MRKTLAVAVIATVLLSTATSTVAFRSSREARTSRTATWHTAPLHTTACLGGSCLVIGHYICRRLYSTRQIARKIRWVYRGTRHVTRSERQMLRRMRRCDRTPRTRTYLLRLNRQARAAWLWRIQNPPGWAIPWPIVKCESGGANLPPNGAGASGYYQIIPGTWMSYGGGAYASQAYLSTKVGQDTVAARIWQGGAGASQWVCAGLVGY